MTGASKKPSGWTKLGNAIDWTSTAAGSFCGFSMLFVSIITSYEVVVRHFFNRPTIWTYDISSYILVWFGFLSSAYGLKQGAHIHVDILVGKMPARTYIPIEIISHALCSLYALIMLIYSWKMAVDAFHFSETAPTLLQAPMYLVELGIVLGCFLLSLQSIRLLIVKCAEWSTRCRQGDDGGKDGVGLLGNPWIILPCYLFFAVFSIWCYATNPGFGLLFTMFLLLFAGVPVFVSLGTVVSSARPPGRPSSDSRYRAEIS